MTEKIRNGDFVELDYTGRLKETSEVFDTTIEAVAKENKIHNPEASYGKLIICVGETHLVKGVDKGLEGKEVGNKYVFELQPEEGFGKKNPRFIQLISTAKFRQQGIMPMPGLQVSIDGLVGIVKTVTGGRTVVDFNHPLAGKELVYEVEAKRIVSDDKEKLEALINLMNLQGLSTKIEEGKAIIIAEQEVPEEIQKTIIEEAKRLIPIIREIVFVVEEKKNKNLNISEATEN